MARIFISYRRDDSAGYVGRLYDILRDHFGEKAIFTDIDTIQPGEDFVNVIEKAVGSSDVVLAIIGKQWLTLTDDSGQRRLDDPNDYVRLEIAAALQSNLRVIPVLVRDASMPRASDLPPDLQPLSRRNAQEISDKNFHHDVNELIQALDQIKSSRRRPALPWRWLAAIGLLGVVIVAALVLLPLLASNFGSPTGTATPLSTSTPAQPGISEPDVSQLRPVDGMWQVTTEYAGADGCSPLPDTMPLIFDLVEGGKTLRITHADEPGPNNQIKFTHLTADKFQYAPDPNTRVTLAISPDHMEEDFSFGNCAGHRVYNRVGDLR